MELIRRSKINRLEESLEHIDGKEKITHIIKYSPIKLTNHKNKTKIIDPNNIKVITQEYTWYKIHDRYSKPIQSFSADILFLNKKNKIEAIIEVVKSNGISEAKFNFYESLGIFWLELSVNEIKTKNTEFCSTFFYDKFKTYKIDLTKFKTENEIIKYHSYNTKKPKKIKKKDIKRAIYLKKAKNIKNNKLKNTNLQSKIRSKICSENPSWSLIEVDIEFCKQLKKMNLH